MNQTGAWCVDPAADATFEVYLFCFDSAFQISQFIIKERQVTH